jgi:hypothetical protein
MLKAPILYKSSIAYYFNVYAQMFTAAGGHAFLPFSPFVATKRLRKILALSAVVFSNKK